MKQISAQKDSDSTKSGKYDRKGETDLPHDLKRLVRIIPHIPVHDLIYKYSCDKLTGSHKDRAPYHLFPQRRAPSGPYALLGKKIQGRHLPAGNMDQWENPRNIISKEYRASPPRVPRNKYSLSRFTISIPLLKALMDSLSFSGYFISRNDWLLLEDSKITLPGIF